MEAAARELEARFAIKLLADWWSETFKPLLQTDTGSIVFLRHATRLPFFSSFTLGSFDPAIPQRISALREEKPLKKHIIHTLQTFRTIKIFN